MAVSESLTNNPADKKINKKKALMKTTNMSPFKCLGFLCFLLLYATSSQASQHPYIAKHGIVFSGGNKYQIETDVILSRPTNSLSVKRYYNSQSKRTGLFGYGWSGGISTLSTLQINGERITLTSANGRKVVFADNGAGEWRNKSGKLRIITATANGYKLTEPNGTVSIYDARGKILEQSDKNSNNMLFSYQGDQLVSVADSFGEAINFTYKDNKVIRLTTPVGTFTYGYDSNNNLASVQKPDFSTKQYLYEDPYDINNLTGIVDEEGVQTLTISYDYSDRVIRSAFADFAEWVIVEYHGDLQRTVTNSAGIPTTYQLEAINGTARVTSFTGPGCSSCGSDTGSAYVYNSRQLATQVTDAKGNVTAYQYDDSGNRIAKTEAVGTSEERTTSWTYDSATNKIATLSKNSVANPGQQSGSSMSYDANGNLLHKTESGYSGTSFITRTSSYTYDAYGRVTSIDGPREDVNDVTNFAYYPNTSDQNQNRGFLQSVTNAFGHVTSYSQYNAFGKAELITTPNGSVSMTYDSNGRILSKESNGIIQSYTYDSTGLLTRIDLPENRYVTYAYDTNARVLSITDNLNNFISYVYDSEGNKTKESVKDPDGTLTRFVDYTYEDTGELDKTILADGSTEDLNYDTIGNLVQRINGAGAITKYTYDALNRLSAIVEPGDVVTQYAYDTNDNLTTVTDAEAHTTSYMYDDLGRKLARVSPDTGQTRYAYDVANNLISKTDGNGITVNYEYDALNRLLAIRYADSLQNVTYAYDQWENSIGRVSAMRDSTGETFYGYDIQGRVVLERRVMAGLTWDTEYVYNDNSALVSIVYPSGRVINYQRDGVGRVITVTSTFEGVTEPLAQDSRYLPFGPRTEATLGNGLHMSNTYDMMYRLTNATAGTLYNRDYQYTATGLVQNVTDNVAPTASQNFVYDELQRLTNAQGKYGVLNYAYDKVGNRLSLTGTSVTDYSYLYGTNKLFEVNGEQTINYAYDDAGNITTKDDDAFTFNEANRIAVAEKSGQVAGEYGYDGNNHRTVKTVNRKTVYSLYDMGGSLLAEYDSTGKVLNEYAYADGQRLALFAYRHVGGTGRGNDGQPAGQENRPSDQKTPPGQDKTPPGQDKKGEHLSSLPNLPADVIDKVLPYYVPFTYYYISDHLGTGQMIVDDTAQVVWQADYQPFGQVDVVVDALDNNLRFPGQYYDAESGLHYNWHRFYDPETGRYISADPIGLAGGMNLYAYVENNPINYIDPEGLFVWGIPAYEAIKWGGAALIAAMGAKAAKETADAIKDRPKTCEEDPCSAYPSRSVAFTQASNYAGRNDNWNKVGWDQYNYPRDKGSQISYTNLRQKIGNDPYGYRSPDGGEVVEHPADGDHPCPHFHAKKTLSGSSEKFPYDPNK
jgi:RHS repeat-associated protein